MTRVQKLTLPQLERHLFAAAECSHNWICRYSVARQSQCAVPLPRSASHAGPLPARRAGRRRSAVARFSGRLWRYSLLRG